jgi:RND family efflux transporter MFP subunit
MRTLLTLGLGLTLLSNVALADVYATFNVKADKEAVLAFTASGTVAKSFVSVGSQVKKGDILAALENSEQKMMLELAKQDFLNASIQAKQSANSLKRYDKVKDILDDEKYEKISFATDMANNTAEKAGFTVRLRQSQLEKTRLRAPFNGVITAQAKQIGDAVTGMQVMPFFQIMDTSVIKLVLEFDERYWDKVKVGQTFVYTVDGSKEKMEARISKVYPTINSANRKLTAEVMTTNLKPGLFGQGLIKID